MSQSSALASIGSRLLGGIPLHRDIAPSVVFTIAYAVLVPLAIFRWVVPATRTWTLLRPTIFITFRIVTWILRAVIGDGHYSEGLLIAEQVLLSVGSIFLIEPLVTLTTKVLEASVPYDGPTPVPRRFGRKGRRRDEVGLVGRVLRLALLAAIGLAVYSASQTAGALTNANTAHTVATLRKISNIILVAVVGICIAANVWFKLLHDIPPRATAFLIATGLILMVASAYRLAASLQDAGVTKPLAFWLALALPEYIATVVYLAINLNSLAPQVNAKDNSDTVPMTNGAYAHDTQHGAYRDNGYRA